MPDGTKHIVIRPGEGRLARGMIFKVLGRDTGGSLSIVEHTLAQGVLIPPHVHADVDQATYVIEGVVGVRLGDQESTAYPGSYIIQRRGIPHAFWNPGKMAAKIIEITSPGDFEGFFEGMAEIIASTGPIGPPDFERLSEFGAQFGTTFLADWVPQLAGKHNVRLMGR